MPKNSSVEVLQRWQAMDQLLADHALIVPTFAEKWGVDAKTIHRDLKAFKKMVGRIVWKQMPDLFSKHYIHGYAPGVKQPLFTSTSVR